MNVHRSALLAAACSTVLLVSCGRPVAPTITTLADDAPAASSSTANGVAVAPPEQAPDAVAQPREDLGCGSLGRLGELRAVPLLDGRLVAELPTSGLRSAPSAGSLYDIYLVTGSDGRLLAWATGYPTRLPPGGAIDDMTQLYRGRYPSVRVEPDPARAGRHRIVIDEPYDLSSTPWSDLDRVLEVTDSAPGDPPWAFTVFISKTLVAADPEGCRAVAERLAAGVREVDEPRAAQGRICVTGASGTTSFQLTVPGDAQWFLVRDRDLDGRTVTVVRQYPLLGGSREAFEVQLGARPVRSIRDGRRFRASLAGQNVEWSAQESASLGMATQEAMLPVGRDALWVLVHGRNRREADRVRARLSGLTVDGAAPCPAADPAPAGE